MEVPAGDHRTERLLLHRYKAVGCLYCRQRFNQHVTGHTHISCPKRPCYLCKKEGHTSNHCPYRIKPNAHHSALRQLSHARDNRASSYHFLRQRELFSSAALHPANLNIRNPHFRAKAILVCCGFHPRRITALEWLPAPHSGLITADKSGRVQVWKFPESHQPSQVDVDDFASRKYSEGIVHQCNVTNFAFDRANPDVAYSAASDGCVAELRIPNIQHTTTTNHNHSTAQSHPLEWATIHNLNPGGWQGRISAFKMAYGLRFHEQRRCLYVGVSDGTIFCLDPRAKPPPTVRAKFHKNKVTCIDVNPMKNDLIVTASNDREVRLWDARKFVPGYEIGSYTHGRVVSAAYFSPNTGTKLLTTSFDNKLCVWNDINAFQGHVNGFPESAPIEIVHSHDFHRYLNPFRAVWDPKDWRDDLFLCGRFLGDAYTDDRCGQEATVLHPLDFFSAKTGTLMHSMVDMSIQLICPLSKFSPASDCIATAASHDLILWAPPKRNGKKRSGKDGDGNDGDGGDADDDDDDGDDGDDDGDERLARSKKRKVSLRTEKGGRSSKRRPRA